MNGKVYISSEYMESMSHVYGRDYKQEVMIWVESGIDIRLWHSVFPHNSAKYDFVFRRSYDCPSSDGKNANGCSRIAKLVKSGDIELGPFVRVCIDSDFRFILNDYSDPFEFVVDNPYVYETLVHSRENVLSNPEGFKGDVQRATSLSTWLGSFDLANFLADFSLSIEKAYLLSLYYKSKKDMRHDEIAKKINEEIDDKLEKKLTSSTAESFESYQASYFFNDLKEACSLIFDNYKPDEYLEEFEKFSSEVLKRIHGGDHIFYFYRGHDLYEKIVKKLCHQLQYNLLLKEKWKRHSMEDKQGIGELYNESIDISQAIELRTNFSRCKFFNLTVEKIRKTLN